MSGAVISIVRPLAAAIEKIIATLNAGSDYGTMSVAYFPPNRPPMQMELSGRSVTQWLVYELSSRMDAYEEEFFDHGCGDDRACGWHDWDGVGSGRRCADGGFAICRRARLQRQAGEECRGGAASSDEEGKAGARRAGAEDGRGRADDH